MNNEMAAQLTALTRQVALLNSRAQRNNEVCGLCGAFGHGANTCPHNVYEPEQVNFMNVNQPRQCFDLYSNTYNPRWRSHPNFSWRNNQAPIQNTMPNPMSNNVEPSNQPRKSTLEETLNTFIQSSMENHERHDKRLDLLEASMKRAEVQVGQIAEQIKEQQKGKLPSEPEQEMTIIVHQNSKENENRVDEILKDNMSLHSDTMGEEIEQPKKEEIIVAPTQSKTDKVSEPMSLPSLHKATNLYRPPIPLKCHPKEADNDKKPLKMKDPRSFMVNISIWVRRQIWTMLNLGASINIMPYSIYQ